jgi:chemotaxis protein MotB
MADAPTPIVIRRVKKVVGGGHHGGSWKVAFADFATAMMAFFLLMWLIAATTKEQRGAISEYFNNPSMMDGRATAPSPGMNGPGGASTSLVKLGSGMELKKVTTKPADPKEIKRLSKELERKRLETLMKELRQAIDASQALEPFKDQLLIDITPAGLRIQIVDKQNRPMFDIGSSQLKPYTVEILHELGAFIQTVPNRISISGHTDNAPYGDRAGYTNWELSADRANAARRALIAGGLNENKVAVVVGLASSVLFDKANPQAPINRRISIVVMNQAEEASLTDGGHDDGTLGAALPDGATVAEPSAEPAAAATPPPATAGHRAAPAGTH